MTIVPIGISLDARPITVGVKALNDLTAAARPAGAAATALEKAVKPAAEAVERLGGSGRGLAAVAAGIKGIGAAAAPATATLTKLQAQINAITGVKAPNSGFDLGASIAHGRALDDLRAKYNPLFAAQRQYKEQLIDINSALRQKAITEKEHKAAITDTKIAFIQQVESIRGTASAYEVLGKTATPATKAAAAGVAAVTKQTGLARHEMINFSRQMQDVGTMAAMGMSPFAILSSQGAQIVDIFASSEGTVGGFLKQIKSGLTSILTPARLVAGSLAGIALAVTAASMSWSGAQRDVQIGLMGIGRASRTTVGDINEIASATSSLNGLSESEAREVATALASTGKIGVDNIKLLTANTKDFATALGLDVPKAAEALAGIFADPSEGAKQLAARIGGIDSVTLKYIETLEQQGDRQGAIKALADAVIPAITGATEKTGNLAKGWNTVSNAASNAWTAIGKATNQIGTSGLNQQGESALEKQRKDLEALIATMQTAKVPDFDVDQAVQQLAAINDALMKIQASRKAALGIEAAQTTLQVAPIITALAPAPELIRQVNANLEAMTRIMNDPAFEAFRQKVGEQLPQALARLANQAAALQLNPRLADPIQSQIDSLVTQNKLLNDQSPAMRARVASQLAYNDAIKQGSDAEEAASIAAARGRQAHGGRATDIQQEQAALSLLGQTATVTEQVRLVELSLQAARLQGIPINERRAALLKQQANDNALGITQIRTSTDALTVETATIGMAVGPATAYAAVQNKINEERRKGNELSPVQIAAIHREAVALGEAAQRADDLRWGYTNLVQGPMQTFRSALSQGSSAMDAFKKAGVSALDAISARLMDMASRALWQNAFPGGGGGFLSMLGFGGSNATDGIGGFGPTAPSFAGGGYTGTGGKHQPAGIVHKGEYVMDAASTSRIGVGRLNALRGFAEGGFVGGPSGATSSNSAPVVTINQTNTFHNADPGSEARMRQALAQTKDAAVREAVQAVAKVSATTPNYAKGFR